ncbi:uncharacterized protein LOC100369923 [Saccoglossus kowalevskii]|uniref:Uncharacterized protein LOC100369923 n=1 Tax=Saccoglossus kowalevskii TaxID=10224 RepID=A0ABM0MDZ1_SACKO|nr:PREDICTED: uncharacterized protein LOC100369923 [Saccoglossus kowalevskii]
MNMARIKENQDALVDDMKNLNISTGSPESKQHYMDLFDNDDFIDDIEELNDLTDVEIKAIMEASRQMFSESQKNEIKKFMKRSAYSLLEIYKDLDNFPPLYSLLRIIGHQRKDIIELLRKHLPAGTAGPKLNREVCIKDMPIEIRLEVVRALSIQRPDGRDWRLIAEQLKIDNWCIKLWEQKKDTPMENVLFVWEKQTGSTVGRLYDMLVKNNMGQIADIL